MSSQGLLLCVLLISIHGSCGQIVLTQSPEYTSVSAGDTLDISCKASEGVSTSRLHWYQQKSGQPPKLLIYGTSNRHTGVPDRFSGSGSGSDYKLTIRGVTEEDAGGYYCKQYQSYPVTFGKKTTVEIKRRENAAPSALLFGPSKEEMDTGKATLVCLVNEFYPGDIRVTWKEDNKEITAGVGQSEKMTDKDNTYSVSSMLILTKDQFKGHNEYSCEVQHSALSSVLTTNLKTAEY